MITFNEIISFIDKAMEEKLDVCSYQSLNKTIVVDNKKESHISFTLDDKVLYIITLGYYGLENAYRLEDINDFQKSIFINRFELVKLYAATQIENTFKKFFDITSESITSMDELDDKEEN